LKSVSKLNSLWDNQTLIWPGWRTLDICWSISRCVLTSGSKKP
jgi:hypothetical protein